MSSSDETQHEEHASRAHSEPAPAKQTQPAGHHAEHHGDMFDVQIWALLVVLLVVSVVGPMLGHPVITLVTAFGIALVKAYLVTKHFMHLAVERRYVVYLLVTMVAIMVLFFAGTAPDVMKHKGFNWKNEAAEQEVKRALDAIKHNPHQAH
ncbi:MAG: cytochrome C oxidase subunit IV family protein [Polyangiaceae bacterium]|nr:cytochrome C oxidase subunit IV family protein [Polyangiaceae bacterium]